MIITINFKNKPFKHTQLDQMRDQMQGALGLWVQNIEDEFNYKNLHFFDICVQIELSNKAGENLVLQISTKLDAFELALTDPKTHPKTKYLGAFELVNQIINYLRKTMDKQSYQVHQVLIDTSLHPANFKEPLQGYMLPFKTVNMSYKKGFEFDFSVKERVFKKL